MTRPLPKNLELLYETFHPKRIGDILQGESFTVDGVEFHDLDDARHHVRHVSRYRSTVDRCLSKR